jgi:nitrogen fixation/metabolism regulation signal transduction histidine kinase
MNFNAMTKELERQRTDLSRQHPVTERRRFMEAVLSGVSPA